MESAKPKVVAIIQARMSSTRLPGKVLLPLGPNNKSVLWWMSTRAGLAKLVDEVVIATTSNLLNDAIVQHVRFEDFLSTYVYRYHGKEDDVIGRVISCAKYYAADIIVDITADCPMVDPKHIDKFINILLEGRMRDYVSNDILIRSWPDGLDIQVYWLDALMKCKRVFRPIQHCGYNIGIRNNYFNNIRCWAPTKYHWPELGVTLDTYEDYELLKILFNEFGKNPDFAVEDVIDYLRNNLKLVEINKLIQRKKPEEG